MEKHFSHYQRYKKNRCNYFQFVKIPVANYNDIGECVLDEVQKTLFVKMSIPQNDYISWF